MKELEIVVAIIFHDDEVLAVKRGEYRHHYIANKYEFAGGKVEQGETKEEALIREIREELLIDIYNLKPFLEVDHTYPDFKVHLSSFICEVKDREITLTEHTEFQWLKIKELKNLEWMEADIPVMEKLVELYG